ncbi:MAG: hypothetical protein DHS20C17_16330 [Cyclobacteriaceae bacterium]|nr:MAG: hypothetical protein DHS20C17_16330 [Cyclobacteriaceae bacterium]
MATIFSCKSNYICPSYESAYILDQPTRHKKFSLFDEDTLPRNDMAANKNKYGVIKGLKYKKKRDEMLTVKMETIFPEVEPPDTMLLAEQDLSPEDMERLINEGERPINQYNVDQIYYMRHFGQYLPMPEEPSIRDEEQDQLDAGSEEILEQPQEKKKQKWKFWKKDIEEVDSVNIGFEKESEIVEPEEQDLSKKELRQQEQLEKEKQEEMQRAREPQVMDLEDFEKDRGISAQPVEETKKGKEKSKAPKKKKKIKLGFGKKNKVDEVELEEP